MEHCKKLTSWDIYGVRKFPYRGKRKYVPGVHRSFYGTITISNDVFGMSIYQFEREFKACLKRRKEREQQIMNIRFPDKTSNGYLDYLKYGDKTVEVQTLSEECCVYRKLIQAAGTEFEIRTKQRVFKVSDKIMNKSKEYPLEYKITSGSLAEGVYLPGSDFDIMRELTDVKVINDLKYLYTCINMEQTTLLSENDNHHPGFSKLKYVAAGFKVSKFINGCFKSDLAGVYLSTESFLNNCRKVCFNGRQDMVMHGPCLSDSHQTCDIAHCLRSKSWPKSAINWIWRHRRGQWPSENLIDTVVNDGCLFVPIGPKNACDTLLWRISFSLAEKRLIHSMNYTQLLCYVLMKLTLRNVINRNEYVKDLLCSYFLKTALFWLSEEISIETFKITNLSYCFSLCIDTLISFVRNCYCPNYFIPQQNMFIGKIDESNNELLLDILSELRHTELVSIIDQIPRGKFSYQSVCYLNDNNKLSLHFEHIFFKHFAVIPFRIESFECGLNKLQYIKQLMKSESSEFILDMLKYYYAKVNQQMSQTIRLPCGLYHSNRICKSNAFCGNVLIEGTYSDAVSGWLLFASYFYLFRNYKRTLQIADIILSRCTSDMIYLKHPPNFNNYKPKTKNHLSLNQRLMKDVLDNVTFLRGSQLIPRELTEEINDNDMDVPPVVMCYCLQFLCYHHLSQVNNRNRALRQLFQTATKANFVEGNCVPTAMTILGVCSEISGDINQAYWCYSDAISYHDNNKNSAICPSAKQRKQNLLRT